MLTAAWLFLTVSLSADSAPPLKVVGTPEIPYRYHDEAGELKGIDIEIIQRIMQTLDFNYTIRLVPVGSRIIKMAQSGDVDIVLSFSKKTDRLAYLVYPKQYYSQFTWNFFIRRNDAERITYQTLKDLESLRVGATQDWSYTEDFWEAHLDLHVETNNLLHLEKLMHGRIDVVPMNTLPTLMELHQRGLSQFISYLPKPLSSKAYYNPTSKHSAHPLLPKWRVNYDRLLYLWLKNGQVKAIYRHYFPKDIITNDLIPAPQEMEQAPIDN
ncbi:substrate-binding periplasmic protein [Zooshikella ganghwensis]|uniref:Amino acid ABC transporter substrate-binding protein n=1 Tax=Zooshikella ganghwensis TaxID=202772 RepID=A0A4P9VM43_9GAMM|nr:transporter substrate-binding domain-containing protein [Zooshikella ganghwensis]RDH43936.1 amino acid ABC transporter substrate-binding protein [Zooshikella ganghwensis]